ncbi:LPXTG cell wall anchor domain-containing protein [Streptomyces sp. SID13666]|uniref:LPXTG cell wall anchor domain-containing protein n=1 Tax=unclassified Streptomyces TaxID=2593676 RepID=UPI0013C00ADF|nr:MULTISPECIES: LPXTG cell wall anchor domain-containing protein [unclassified Streptomyces]NEA55479.1 LPXTG cell wall anchor domain-containing protein [Streptomyces sp. SID13666]NEA71681.1 LPXTG cell wall anchor domain-containing protein [Streptomyces sp. SID13588]
MGRHTRAILAGLGLAGLLLAAGPVAEAQADAGPVDADVQMQFLHPQVAPGRQFHFYLLTHLKSGTLSTFRGLVHLPEGMTYVPVVERTCEPTSANKREIACRPDSQSLTVQVADDVPVGTRLTITATADIGDAVDTHPEDNTARQEVLVKPGADWSVKWTGPTTPVQPGSTPVTTRLVVTNHGQEADLPFILTSGPGDYPRQMEYYGKWDKTCGIATEGNGLLCRPTTPVPPGGTITYTFRFKVYPAALGKEQRREARVSSEFPATEPDINDNTTTLVVKVADKAAQPTGKPTSPATGGAKPTSVPTTAPGDHLADTGGAGTGSALTAAGAAAVVGGGLLLTSRRRRRNH